MYRIKCALSTPHTLRVSIYALLLAMTCVLLTPLSAAACGGLFSADAYTEQSAERLIFAVNPGRVTLYEQIHYTGSPKDFAWVLPVPAVPVISTASMNLFQDLDQQTSPRFYTAETSSCGFTSGAGAVPPQSSGPVNVYTGGNAGPYSYNVVGSSDPQALTQWLNGHHYKIPADSQAEMQPYIAAHMLFLAMRLQGNTGIQDMAPVKITYASSQSAITIPLRMATPMGKEPLNVLVWIFANSRYVPQNYQPLQLNYTQLNTNGDLSTAYANLVRQAVTKANGHGFVTEYAGPTSNLFANDQNLSALKQQYRYLTRMYTSIAPSQINLDPGFVAQAGRPDIASIHAIAGSDSSQGSSCFPAPLLVGSAIGGTLVVVVVGTLLFVIIRRRMRARLR